MDKIVKEWQNWANALGTAKLYYKEDFTRMASSLPEREVVRLAAFYSKAVTARHVESINSWLRSLRGTRPMSDAEKGIRNIFHLFAYIAELDRAPFTSQVLKPSVEATPDWSKLPAELRFLAEPAQACAARYNYVFSEIGRERIQNTASALDKSRLAPIADQVRAIGFDTVKAWYNRLGLWEHVEAALVFDLMGVLDAMGLPYC